MKEETRLSIICSLILVSSFINIDWLPLVVCAAASVALGFWEDKQLAPRPARPTAALVSEPFQVEPSHSVPSVSLQGSSEDRVRQRMTPAQLKQCELLLARLSADTACMPEHPTHFLNLVNARRFLQARHWNVAVAEKLWKKAIDWRASYGLTEKRRQLERARTLGHSSVDDFVDKHWFAFCTGPDIYGTPATIFRASTSDPHGLYREVDRDLDFFLVRYLDMLESCLEKAIEQDRFDFGTVEITDLRDIGEPNYLRRAITSVGVFKKIAHILDEVYAERLRNVFLLGAPSVFQTVWTLVTPFVPLETRAKIRFVGNEQQWINELVQAGIPVSSIPKYLGGQGSDAQVKWGGMVKKDSLKMFNESEWSEPIKVGLISDVQYVDLEDGFNFRKTRTRKYRESLRIGLTNAVTDFNAHRVEMVLQLGDLIDGQCKKHDGHMHAIERTLEQFQRLPQGVEVHHLVGNHELYNFDRKELAQALQSPVHPRSVFPKSSAKYRFVLLDPYEHAVIGGVSDDVFSIAESILLKNHPRDWRKDRNWLNGVYGIARRFVPYNGALSKEQLDFLEGELVQAVEAGQYVVICSHIPLQPGACSSSCLVWNFEQVLAILHRYAAHKYQGEKGVVCVFAGHDHKGGEAVDKEGIFHITLSSPLEAPGCEAHAVLLLGRRGLYIQAFGAEKHRYLPFPTDANSAERSYKQHVRRAVTEFHDMCVEEGFDKSFEQCEAIWHQYGGAWDALPSDEWPLQYKDGG